MIACPPAHGNRAAIFLFCVILLPSLLFTLDVGGAIQAQARSARSTNGTLSQLPPSFYVLDPNNYRSYFPDDDSFSTALQFAPFLDLPFYKENYHDCLVAFYYRIRSYRKHIQKTANGRYWVVTEFLPKVPWAGADNTISAAAGHHILEGRWFWDAPTFVEDYIRFWYLGGSSNPQQQMPQPQPHIALYTNWIYHATWQYALLWGMDDQRQSLLCDTLPQAVNVFRNIYIEKYLTNSTRNAAHWNTTNRVCWAQDDGYDAMEVSVSGGGCRPTIAAVMWGEAMAFVHVATFLSEQKGYKRYKQYHDDIIQEFSHWGFFSKQVITEQHWNPAIDSFAVIPPPIAMKMQSEEYISNQKAQCDIHKIRTPNQPVNVRELLAYMPWYYAGLLKGDDDTTSSFARQFQWLLDSTGENGFTAHWGLRTVQRNTPCYNYSWDHGDCWNGPSWPYETSRVLTAIANLLADNSITTIKASGVTASRWESLFLQYARQHTETSAVNDTAHPLNSGHVFENLHPDLGYWNNRARMYWNNQTDTKNMGDDYNHSTFLDLVLGSWLGIRFSSNYNDKNQPWLVVKPLIQAPYFAVDRVPYRGRVLSIVYDPIGSHYPKIAQQKTKGLLILLEGKIVAHRPDMGLLVVQEEPTRDERVSII